LVLKISPVPLQYVSFRVCSVSSRIYFISPSCLFHIRLIRNFKKALNNHLIWNSCIHICERRNWGGGVGGGVWISKQNYFVCLMRNLTKEHLQIFQLTFFIFYSHVTNWLWPCKYTTDTDGSANKYDYHIRKLYVFPISTQPSSPSNAMFCTGELLAITVTNKIVSVVIILYVSKQSGIIKR
jgi:hypothetical protein